MNIEFINELIMPIIVIACFCVGYVIKKWLPTDDKWIPTIVCIIGAVLGAILTEKPSADTVVTGIVAGALSGLASTGVHQLIKQHLKLEDIQNTFTNYLDAEEMLAEVKEYEDTENRTKE